MNNEKPTIDTPRARMKTDYKTYLASREWAVRRESVRKRANGKCERCLSAEMQSVHHLSYERVGDEPLTDLLGVCNPCHEFVSAKSDIDPMTDGVRVYLAGPITGNPWRDELLVGDRSVFPSQTKPGGNNKNGYKEGDWPMENPGFDDGLWPIVSRGMRDGFDFTGPWFEDVSGGNGVVPKDPHGWVTCERTHECLESPAYILDACMESIAGSDVVFCWIPSGCSPYGSVWELGYATALNKLVVLCEQTGHANDRWFAGANADVWVSSETPCLAWKTFVDAWKRSTYLRGHMLRGENRSSSKRPNIAIGSRQGARIPA